MSHTGWIPGLLCAGLFMGLLFSTARGYAEGGYPADYKPSKPAEKGETNALNRVLAISNYMTDKLNAAGGQNSPMCYRNCITIPFNEILKCIETNSSYAATEGCEQDAAQKMAACNPQCQ